MPRAFTEQEKNKIRTELLAIGKELFTQYGLKKTSIKELTDKVEIAQGSFYSFFDSKEELYFTILQQEEAKLKEKLLTKDFITGPTSGAEFKDFLTTAFELVADNPLLKRLYTGNEYELLVRKLPAEKIEEHIAEDEFALVPLIENWQQQKQIINKNPAAIVGMLRGIFTISLHQEEIGEEIYEEALDLLLELVAKGLVKDQGGKTND